MVNDFISKEDLSLFTSGSRFPLASVFFKEGLEDTVATFDLLVRDLPPSRNFLVFAGLEHVADYLVNLKFNPRQLQWIKESFSFPPEIMNYFKKFRFTGNMYAMPEGTIFFPNEPVIRITAPLIEAQLIEMFLINTVYVQTILATKIARVTQATNGKPLALGFNRSYGLDTAIKNSRVSDIFGVLNQLALYYYKNNHKTKFYGTFHYLMMAFDTEKDAFKAFLRDTKGKGYLLVDTYDTVKGIKNYIESAEELKEEGIKVTGIQLDSGDLYQLSKVARRMLDEAGLPEVKIFAMSDLDEYKIEKLEKKAAPIDVYAGLTNILTPTDAPTIELVYKLAEIKKGNKIIPKMKTSTKKISLPGRKQVYRIEKNGKYIEDAIALDKERYAGKKLLKLIINRGKLVYKYPSLKQIGKHYNVEKKKFKHQLFDLKRKAKYPVNISPLLEELTKQTKKSL